MLNYIVNIYIIVILYNFINFPEKYIIMIVNNNEKKKL